MAIFPLAPDHSKSLYLGNRVRQTHDYSEQVNRMQSTTESRALLASNCTLNVLLRLSAANVYLSRGKVYLSSSCGGTSLWHCSLIAICSVKTATVSRNASSACCFVWISYTHVSSFTV